MNKYYTPKISEFHVGFEYETWIQMETGCDWFKTSFHEYDRSVSKARIFDSIKEQLEKKHLTGTSYIRVKYLTREDIESEKWTFFGNPITKNANYVYSIRSKTIMEEGLSILKTGILLYTLNHYPHKNKITITDCVNGKTKFEGTIKNKSQLKIILKQTGVIK